jgi:hypothetical protein
MLFEPAHVFAKALNDALERRSARRGISAVDYLSGIVEGRFPRLTWPEIEAAALIDLAPDELAGWGGEQKSVVSGQ